MDICLLIMDICLNAISFFTLSYITQNAQRSGNCRQETDGDLKNGLPSVCFHLALFLRLVETWFSLIDFKEVGVHGTHGNAVINHTLCVFRWLIFQLPRSLISCPYFGRHWCPAPDINRDLNVSSMKTDFRCKRSFLSIAGAKVQKSVVGCNSFPVTWIQFSGILWNSLPKRKVKDTNGTLAFRSLVTGHYRSLRKINPVI